MGKAIFSEIELYRMEQDRQIDKQALPEPYEDQYVINDTDQYIELENLVTGFLEGMFHIISEATEDIMKTINRQTLAISENTEYLKKIYEEIKK